VTDSEIAAAVGLLDPADPRTAKAVNQLVRLVEKQAAHRVLSPDPAIWRDAGLTSGVLARLRNHNREDRRKALNDALLFFTTLKHGFSVSARRRANPSNFLRSSVRNGSRPMRPIKTTGLY
jgi:hypothetical protein